MIKSLTITGITVSALLAITLATRVPDYKINPNVTQENIGTTICRAGWTATIRPPVSYTNKLKRVWLQDQYGTSTSPISNEFMREFEEDHILSLELGGSPTDPKNLIPQPYKNPIGGINMGAREKDVVESYLHREVCAGRMKLIDAQNTLINDWAKTYLKIKGIKVESSDTDD